eukprot:CAMPEP_0174855082 /NCGR_PEP_ID=MMETSP1114-20130205/32427_1 /TAXON_ID=312471 /ORGANISM="Neobodo designis, Strain CCAP 1951/1" /LENGTH=330 /DNA_ID=CAMNT_0016089803 /DNA_START=89 /DNA_END=1081 /DNA_ORIENTATION=+
MFTDNEPTLHPSFSRAARIVPIASDGAPSWHREVSPPAGFAPTRTPHHAPHVGSSADSVSASTPPAAGGAAPPLAGCESMLLPPPASAHRAGAAHQTPNGLAAGAAEAGVLRSLSPSDAIRVAAGAAAGALIAKGLWTYMRLRSAKGGRAAGPSAEVGEKKTLPPKMPTSSASVGSASLGSAAHLDQSPLRPPPPATVRRFRRPAPAARAAVPVSPADCGVGGSGGGDFEDLGAWGDAASPVAPPVTTPRQQPPTGATTVCRLRDAAPAAGAQATAATFAQRGGEGTTHEEVARFGRRRDADNNNSFDHDDAPTEAPLRNAPGSEWMLVK